MARTLVLETVEFMREEKSKKEVGVMFNEGEGPLVDMDGKVVPAPLWHWRPRRDLVATVREDE